MQPSTFVKHVSLIKFKAGQRLVLNPQGMRMNREMEESNGDFAYPAHIRLVSKDYALNTWSCYGFNGMEVDIHEEDFRLYYNYE